MIVKSLKSTYQSKKMTRKTITIQEHMFERLIEEIRICDFPSELEVVLTNYLNDTLYYTGGQKITISHFDTQTKRRCYVEFPLTQLVGHQKFQIINEITQMMQRDLENIMDEAINVD